MSHPSRGGWIEICLVIMSSHIPPSHPSRGGWIEIDITAEEGMERPGPTPHGVGGLKFIYSVVTLRWRTVPPLTGWVD